MNNRRTENLKAKIKILDEEISQMVFELGSKTYNFLNQRSKLENLLREKIGKMKKLQKKLPKHPDTPNMPIPPEPIK